MSVRAAAGLLVSAVIRRIEALGGHAMVLAKGDATAGAILFATADRGVATGLYERMLGPAGYGWALTGPQTEDAPGALGEYIARRRRSDPDLWVVEIDHRDAIAIARDVIG